MRTVTTEAEGTIFELTSWRGAYEQQDTLAHAARRINHSGSSISSDKAKAIIENALADEKDLIGQTIEFLKVEEHRFLEKAPDTKQPVPITEPETEAPRSKTSLFDAVDPNMSFWFIRVNMKTVLQWIKKKLG